MRQGTLLAQAGSRWDAHTGAISMPIHQCATFRHPGLGQSTGFDYARTANPTRSVLEEMLAELDGGARASAFASGLAAVDAVLRLFAPGDKIVVTEDLYGGTFRLFERCYRAYGIDALYVDTADAQAVAQIFVENKNIKALFIEIPTNPMLKVADLAVLSALAKKHGALFIVDNTFLTPCQLRPLDLGADIALYSGTKYLGGHNDLLAGIAVAKTKDLGDRIAFFQNAAGAILGPMDSWLLLRGLKTLPLRLKKQEENAHVVAAFLAQHRKVRKVFYPGLVSDQGHETLKRQAKGFGGMVAFEVDGEKQVPALLAGVKTFLFAESLGGVESLVTFPAVQTHADIGADTRERLGINNRLLRLSIGIEDADDLIEDLDQALER